MSESPNQATVAALSRSLAAALDGASGEASPHRFTLFHAANSICSQKVRVVLAHHGVRYNSQLLNIFAGETYLPDHVRLRMIGCERAGLPLVTGHRGSTATADGGCDPAVVPTLIDHTLGAIIVDSKAICRHIDSTTAPALRLTPEALWPRIDAELATVDSLPNYQMLVGRPSIADGRPARLREADGAGFSMAKVARCDRYLEDFADDADLVAAYRAKRAKELDAAQRLFSPDAMAGAYSKIESACVDLNARLGSAGPWLFGATVTMADLFWAVELIRIDNLGAAHFWADGQLPRLEAFVARLRSLASVRTALLDWPGALY